MLICGSAGQQQDTWDVTVLITQSVCKRFVLIIVAFIVEIADLILQMS